MAFHNHKRMHFQQLLPHTRPHVTLRFDRTALSAAVARDDSAAADAQAGGGRSRSERRGNDRARAVSSGAAAEAEGADSAPAGSAVAHSANEKNWAPWGADFAARAAARAGVDGSDWPSGGRDGGRPPDWLLWSHSVHPAHLVLNCSLAPSRAAALRGAGAGGRARLRASSRGAGGLQSACSAAAQPTVGFQRIWFWPLTAVCQFAAANGDAGGGGASSGNCSHRGGGGCVWGGGGGSGRQGAAGAFSHSRNGKHGCQFGAHLSTNLVTVPLGASGEEAARLALRCAAGGCGGSREGRGAVARGSSSAVARAGGEAGVHAGGDDAGGRCMTVGRLGVFAIKDYLHSSYSPFWFVASSCAPFAVLAVSRRPVELPAAPAECGLGLGPQCVRYVSGLQRVGGELAATATEAPTGAGGSAGSSRADGRGDGDMRLALSYGWQERSARVQLHRWSTIAASLDWVGAADAHWWEAGNGQEPSEMAGFAEAQLAAAEAAAAARAALSEGRAAGSGESGSGALGSGKDEPIRPPNQLSAALLTVPGLRPLSPIGLVRHATPPPEAGAARGAGERSGATRHAKGGAAGAKPRAVVFLCFRGMGCGVLHGFVRKLHADLCNWAEARRAAAAAATAAATAGARAGTPVAGSAVSAEMTASAEMAAWAQPGEGRFLPAWANRPCAQWLHVRCEQGDAAAAEAAAAAPFASRVGGAPAAGAPEGSGRYGVSKGDEAAEAAAAEADPCAGLVTSTLAFAAGGAAAASTAQATAAAAAAAAAQQAAATDEPALTLVLAVDPTAAQVARLMAVYSMRALILVTDPRDMLASALVTAPAAAATGAATAAGAGGHLRQAAREAVSPPPLTMAAWQAHAALVYARSEAARAVRAAAGDAAMLARAEDLLHGGADAWRRLSLWLLPDARPTSGAVGAGGASAAALRAAQGRWCAAAAREPQRWAQANAQLRRPLDEWGYARCVCSPAEPRAGAGDDFDDADEGLEPSSFHRRR